MVRIVCAACIALLLAVSTCFAQSSSHSPGAFVGGFFGSGGMHGSSGAFVGGEVAGKLFNPGTGIVVELGGIGPTPDKAVDGLFNINAQPTFLTRPGPYTPTHNKLLGFFNVGYTRFFSNGNGLNYGGGLVWRYTRKESEFSAIRFEYREYFLNSWGRQPEIRITWEHGDEDMEE